MRGLLIAAAALLCGTAWAQGGTPADTGAMCRSFCDADANACRKDVAFRASSEADPLVALPQQQRADKDDMSEQRQREQAQRSADKDRYAGTQGCAQTRLACRQKCDAPAAAAAASATH